MIIVSTEHQVTQIIENIINIEGRVFHHDPQDAGGETLCGISRNSYPDLEVWEVVDRLRKVGVSNKDIAERTMYYVVDFYRGIWDKYKLSNYDVHIAEEMFDQVINPGPSAMTTNVQRVINALNYRDGSGVCRIVNEDLIVDGKYGPRTISALLSAQSKGYIDEIVFSLNALQLEYYIRSTEKRTINRRYFLGWMRHRCMK